MQQDKYQTQECEIFFRNSCDLTTYSRWMTTTHIWLSNIVTWALSQSVVRKPIIQVPVMMARPQERRSATASLSGKAWWLGEDADQWKSASWEIGRMSGFFLCKWFPYFCIIIGPFGLRGRESSKGITLVLGEENVVKESLSSICLRWATNYLFCCVS